MKWGSLAVIILVLTMLLGCSQKETVKSLPTQATLLPTKTEAPETPTVTPTPVLTTSPSLTIPVRSTSTTTTTPLPIPPSPEELAEQNFTLPEIPRILCEQLKQMIDKGDDFILVDARLNSNFTSGHITGAINIPAEDSSPTFTQEWVDNQLKTLPADKMIIFYCD